MKSFIAIFRASSLALSLIISLPAFSQKDLKASLKINVNAKPQVYSKMIFGGFIEHFHRQIYGGIFEPGSNLSDEQGFRKDVMAALREMNMPIVRWPGGCFVSSYHWLDGVGKNRTPAYDRAWMVEDPNTFGTDEYIAWCRKTGIEPYICTNAGTGTPEEMSDWIEYCNLNVGKFGRMRIANGHPEPYHVKYWSIGNENYGGWEMGAKTVAEWGHFVRESAKLMIRITPNVKLLAAALADESWTTPLLKTTGDLLNYVSIHGYWDMLAENNNPSDYLTCMLKTKLPEQEINHTIEILKKTGFDKTIKIAFDEWNLRGWHHPGIGDRYDGEDIKARDKNDINSTYTMADALFSACFLNACMRNSDYVEMACIAPIVNTRGPLYVYPGGIVKRTTYYVLQLYASKLQPNILPFAIQSDSLSKGDLSVPTVDAVVTCSNDKKVFSFALVNKDPTRNAECTLGLDNLGGTPSAIVLSGDSPDAFNDVSRPDRVTPESRKVTIKNGKVIIPAHSLMILTLTR